MLGFGETTAAPAAGGDLIKETTDATFMADVVEASRETPVIVDFWAPWCGPCRTLGPALEAAVTAAKGAVKMVKINVDENQGYAGQLRVQSIPTVYAFWQGQPVDGFQGAIQQSEIKKFVEKLAALAGQSADGGLSEALEAAEAMLAEGAAADAAPSSRSRGRPTARARWPSCARRSRPIRRTFRPVMTSRSRCMPPGRSRRRWTCSSTCSAGTASGTTVPRRRSFSPFSRR